jgi:hypothetical protein
MGNVPEMNAVPAGEVNVVLGDFNVDTFGNTWNAYNWMLQPGGIYRCELDPRAGYAGPVVPARKPYCMTHILPANDATPFNTAGGVAPDPQHNVYPRYGYMGNSFPAIGNVGAIDNVFRAYGAGAAVPPSNITVVNTLTGTPYNLLLLTGFGVPAGVTGELTGGQQYNSSLPLPNMLTNPPPATPNIGGINSTAAGAAAHLANFQGWTHLGGVRSTSDHLALLVDV